MDEREALRAAVERRGLVDHRGIRYIELAEMLGIERRALWQMFNRRPTSRGEVLLKSGMTARAIEAVCDGLNVGLVYRPGQGWSTVDNWPGKEER